MQCLKQFNKIKSSGDALALNLQEVDLPLKSDQFCLTRFGSQFFVSTMFCVANGIEKDTCQGDSGGTLVHYNSVRAQWEIQGLTSWGYGCAANNPGVYTRVATYYNWIIQTITNASG